MGTDTTHRPAVVRWVTGVTAVCAVLVMLAPLGLSAWSLSQWATDELGITGPLAYAVPATADLTALTFIGLTYLAAFRGQGGGISRVMVWVMIALSAVANARHGATIGLDATIGFAVCPAVTGVMLEVIIRRTLRDALVALGAVDPPLPRFRAARWLPGVAFLETLAAWKVAVREGITSPRQAVAAVRLQNGDHQADEAVTHLAQLAEEVDELAAMTKGEALRAAFLAIDAIDAPRAITWLAQRGIEVSPTYAHKVAREQSERAAAEAAEAAELPAVTALPVRSAGAGA